MDIFTFTIFLMNNNNCIQCSKFRQKIYFSENKRELILIQNNIMFIEKFLRKQSLELSAFGIDPYVLL